MMPTNVLDEEETDTQNEWVAKMTWVLGAPADFKPNVEEDSPVEKVRRERRRALIVPREHGAWGLLLVPMITGGGIALRESNNAFPLLLLVTAALMLFWLRTPLESLMGTSAIKAQTDEERRDVMFAAGYLATIAGVALAMLLWAGHNPYLWWIGIAAGVTFAAQALKNLGRSTRMLSEIVGTIGLTASAPAAYYVVTGKLGPTAWMLWLANILFAGDQIHYVQLRIHTAKVQGFRAKLARGWAFALGQAIMTAIITLACMTRLMPPIASLAFSPLLFRGWFYFVQGPKPLVVRRLGWSELEHATAFCVLLIATFILAK